MQKRVYTRSLCISLNAFHLFLLNLCIDFVSELYRIGDKVKFVGDPPVVTTIEPKPSIRPMRL